MKRIKDLFIICVMMASLTACGYNAVPAVSPVSVTAGTTEHQEFSDMVLSKAQMISDYDSLWQTLKQNYPFWGVLSRKHPENPYFYNTVIADYREQIEDMELEGDDAMWRFIEIVSNSYI